MLQAWALRLLPLLPLALARGLGPTHSQVAALGQRLRLASELPPAAIQASLLSPPWPLSSSLDLSRARDRRLPLPLAVALALHPSLAPDLR